MDGPESNDALNPFRHRLYTRGAPMVAKGQYLERPTVIPVAGVVMEALSHRGTLTPSLLILPPTPSEGGSMDHIVGAELSWAAAREGFPTLRFNWRGVGASQGKRGQFKDLLEDAQAALAASTENVGSAPFLAAIGGAASVALELKNQAAGVCLIGPDIDVWPQDVWAIVGQRAKPQKFDASSPRITVIPEADSSFQRNLPMVGKAVIECLRKNF